MSQSFIATLEGRMYHKKRKEKRKKKKERKNDPLLQPLKVICITKNKRKKKKKERKDNQFRLHKLCIDIIPSSSTLQGDSKLHANIVFTIDIFIK
jgi:hypothetical protein